MSRQTASPAPPQTPSSDTTYVLDTSVLLSSPGAIFTFAEHEVVIPLVVLKELEAKRHDPTLGFQAREALRHLEALRERGDLREGVQVTDVGGTARIEVNHVNQAALPDALANDRTHDTRILAVAKNLATEGDASAGGQHRVVVVSKDLPMRILAETLGLAAQEYRREQVVVDKPYTGYQEVEVGTAFVEVLHSNRTVRFADLSHEHLPGQGGADRHATIEGLPINTGVHLIGPNSSALGVIGPDKTVSIVNGDAEAFGVKGRTAEQKVALTHLLNPDVGIVSLGGLAGAGKTLLALAAGLEAVMERKSQERIIVFRPLHAVGGQDLGYLPGTAEEKMGPWGAAIFDAMRAFTSQDVIDEVIDRNLLEILPLTHVRGRSLHKAFVILDEAQNLERSVLLTALSRLGEGSRVVLSWDAAQRDNLHVGRHDGIAAVVERLKGHALFAHTTFTKSERGPIARLVTDLMDDFGN